MTNFDHYQFKTQPFDHQLKTFQNTAIDKDHALFMEMGTGKTKIIIDTAAFLFMNNQIKNLLVIAPKGTYRTWNTEIETHMPSIPSHTFIWGTLKDEKQVCQEQEGLKILLMNVEAFSQKKGTDFAKSFLKSGESMMIIDESTTIKNHRANRTKNILSIAKLAKYKRILTGTPITKSPLDLFTQCLFLGSDYLGFSSYYSFRNRFAIMEQKRFGSRSFAQVAGFQRVEELNNLLSKFSTRLTKDDCLDLPEKVYITREVELTEKQKKYYKEMATRLRAEIDEEECTVTTALTKIVRLHQISCGHLITDEENMYPIETNRLNSLLEIIEETEDKILIWATYIADIERIEKFLKEKFGEKSIVSYYGNTKEAAREEAIKNFQGGDHPRFFVGNPQTGGYGLTLTASATVIYYSNSYNLEHRLQSEDRVHRIGQTRTVTYVDLVARNTVDEKIIRCLTTKRNISNEVLGDRIKDWLSITP